MGTVNASNRELVSKLHKRGVQVYLVSGGFQSLIAPVAQELDIPMENVFANRLKFYFDGGILLSVYTVSTFSALPAN